MGHSQILKIGMVSFIVLTLQACATSKDVEPRKTNDHIKSEVPPPFPITPESLRKEREAAARKQAEQSE